jgi:hypothetical protein
MESEATSPQEQALLRKSISAYEIVNFYSREQIANIIYQVNLACQQPTMHFKSY